MILGGPVNRFVKELTFGLGLKEDQILVGKETVCKKVKWEGTFQTKGRQAK